MRSFAAMIKSAVYIPDALRACLYRAWRTLDLYSGEGVPRVHIAI